MDNPGKPQKPTEAVNCLSCSKYPKCADLKKGSGYACELFKEIGTLISLDSFVQTKITKEIEQNKFNENRIQSSQQNIEELVNQLIDSDDPVPPDLKVDDRDLKVAKNFYDFAANKEYLGVKLYPKQLEIGFKLYGEYCPRCSDSDYIDYIPTDAKIEDILDRVVLLEHNKCPKCKVTKTELVENQELNDYYEMAGCAGQRGGKSALFSIQAAYTHHQYLKLNDPLKTFGLLKNSTLHATFIALTFEQAKDTLWDPFHDLITTSPWFVEYHKLLKYYGNRYGEELYKIGEAHFRYRHKSLLGYCKGPDKRILRGKTRYLGGIDELGWFDVNKAKSVKMNAHEVYIAMKRSFTTVKNAHRNLRREGYNNVPNPIFGNISSPSSVNDKIMSLYKQSEGSRSLYGFHLSTWEMNPNITKEDLEDEFKADPVNAWRDYGACPPLSSSSFIDKEEHLGSLIGDKENAIICEAKNIVTSSKKVMKGANLKFRWTDRNCPKVLSIDAGSTNNSFAISVAHIDQGTGKSVYDILLEIVPSREHPINFNYVMAHVIDPLVSKFGVRLVVSDQWQSKKLLDDIEEKHKIKTVEYRLQYADFEMYRQNIYDSRIQYPKNEIKIKDIVGHGTTNYPDCFYQKPVAHLILQCLTVQDVFGKHVEKGETTTDDLFRSTVLAHRFLIDEEYSEILKGNLVRSLGDKRVIGAMQSHGQRGLQGSGTEGNKIGVFSAARSGGNTQPSTYNRGPGPRIFSRK